MQNLRSFEVKYIPCTNTKPSRIKITDMRSGRSIIVSYASEGGQGYEQAKAILESCGIPILYHSWDESTQNSYLLTDNFETAMGRNKV